MAGGRVIRRCIMEGLSVSKDWVRDGDGVRISTGMLDWILLTPVIL